jgi:bacillithiol biosynthesis cysteine-adding enzyme BshC
VYNQQVYAEYINRSFSIENFEKQIDEKERNYQGRGVLVEALKHQYAEIKDLNAVEANIKALSSENTFTVTTGHQLSLFTGPLYFIVKILHVIKLSERLNSEYPDNRFVPVFWMASEDHDFEEIQSTNLFGKKLTWESEQKGPVGRFDLDGFDAFKEEIAAFYKNHPESPIHELLETYDGSNLTEATRKLVHTLFKEYGLVIIDGDDPTLKQQFAPIIEKELDEEFSFKAVEKTNESLKKDGGKIQVKAREINLFYVDKGVRSRIQRNDVGYLVDGVGTFTQDEIKAELANHPERFSPNVILRPLYQETILPNLAYIGGVGEMTYWLQLKGVFDEVGCTYPMIAVRNSVMWIDGAVGKKMGKIDLHIEDTFRDTDLIKKEYVEQHAGEELDFSELDATSASLSKLIEDMVLTIDADKKQYAAGEIAKLEKQISGVKGKMLKHSKAKHEEAMKLIDFVKKKLFPDDGLQERGANFFSFCPDGNYSQRIRTLYNALNPEESDFIVLLEI